MTSPGAALVGRQRELGRLSARLTDLGSGHGGLVLVAGEPGIGKTRLAQALAGQALAAGTTVAWGRCVEAEGAPAFWPWEQVLRSLGAAHAVTTLAESPEERFRLYDAVTATLTATAVTNALVLVLDDIHWADEPSVLLLQHVARHLDDAPILVVATFRDVETSPALERALPQLTGISGTSRIDLTGLDTAAVTEQLRQSVDPQVAEAHAARVAGATGGNPLFVREVARALADGTWRDDRPPRSVLDVVTGRLHRVSPECRRFVQVAAVVGRDLRLPVVAAALDSSADDLLPAVDEALRAGLLDRVGESGEYRFVHALTRDAVQATIDTQQRLALHRAVADAIARVHAADLTDHLADLARHWAQLAPYGEAATARSWAVRAGDEAVRRLAYEEGVRLYRAALSYDATDVTDADRCRLQLALAHAAYFAGDLAGCVAAASEAAAAAERAGDTGLLAESALAVEAAPDLAVNATAKDLADRALTALGDNGDEAQRARLLALQSHLAFYGGDGEGTAALSRQALDLARASGDDGALVEALRARQEALPGQTGRPERFALAEEMIATARRLGSPRAEMWGRIWWVEALAESGRFAEVHDALPDLAHTVQRVGGPVSAWHLDRVTACVAQVQARFDEADAVARRGFARMRPYEPAPASGAYLALQSSLARHLGPSDDLLDFVRSDFAPPPRFRVMGAMVRAYVLLLAGAHDEAAVRYHQAGPVGHWDLPYFFTLGGLTNGAVVAAGLGYEGDVAALLDQLAPHRGEHVVGNAVSYMGPVDLALGIGAAAIGRYDDAVVAFRAAVELAENAGASAFAAEARYRLATVLRDSGERAAALAPAREAARATAALGMTLYVDRAAALLADLDRAAGAPGVLTARETEIAALLADGLSNQQIADRLVISLATVKNHVHHVLDKLGASSRSDAAARLRGRPPF